MPSVEGVKISQLPQANTLDESDVLAGVQTGTTKKFALSTLVAWIKAHLNLTAADVGAVPTSAVGAAGGVAGLDSSGKVPAAELDLSGKQNTITASGILKGDGLGGVSAAAAGTDYQAPLVAGTDYATPGMIPTVPSAYASNPEMDGTASPGSSGAWAKGDHVHPSDTTKVNQAQLATVETGSNASRNYAVEEYFCLNGLLYRVISAISSGQPFNPGANCEQVTEGGLNSLIAVQSESNFFGNISTSKVGKIAMLSCPLGTYNTDNAGYIVDANNQPVLIPAGFRPLLQVEFYDAVVQGRGQVETTGGIKFPSKRGLTAQAFRFSATYIARQ